MNQCSIIAYVQAVYFFIKDKLLHHSLKSVFLLSTVTIRNLFYNLPILKDSLEFKLENCVFSEMHENALIPLKSIVLRSNALFQIFYDMLLYGAYRLLQLLYIETWIVILYYVSNCNYKNYDLY